MKLGKINVDKMLRRIPAKLFEEWMHYDLLEPFGEIRDDYRAASICTMLANLHRGNRQAYGYDDFRVRFGSENAKKKQTPEEQLQIALMWCAAYGVDTSHITRH